MRRCLSFILVFCITVLSLPITTISAAGADDNLYIGSFGYEPNVIYDENGNVVETGGRLKPDTNFSTMSESTIPSSYDARSKSLVTPVKNQGASSNCWVFATTSVLESNSIINGYTKLGATDFSEPHLAWFSVNTRSSDISDPNCGEGSSGDAYNLGGTARDVLAALARWAGVADGSKVSSNYPTTSSQLSKLPKYTDADRFNTSSGVIVRSMETCTTADAVKQWIIDNGSITASYFHSTSSNYIKNGSNYTAYCYNESDYVGTNHMIAVVGWDDNFAASKFNSNKKPAGNGAWLCKNSWGSGWGNGSGYFWISYYDTSICDFIGFTTQPADKFDNNYTYNADECWASIHGDKAKTIANVFTAKYSEKLSAVSTYTLNPGVTVNAKIYKNVSLGEANNPTNGELMQSVTVTLQNAGYHTIDLPESVALEHGCVFSVVLEMTASPSGYLNIPVETWDTSTSTEGQSLILAGDNWYTTEKYDPDRQYKNFFIQAFSVTTCDHLNQDTVIKKYDDCSGQGYERIVCLDCNGILKETLYPRIAHTPGAWTTAKEASCTETGLSVKICTVCNQTVETQEIPMLEHVAEWKVDLEPTCTREGREERTCSVCNKYLESRDIPMIDHNPGDWEVERVTTCTVAGILAKKCTECSLILETQDIPVTGHSPGEWKTEYAPTCQGAGLYAQKCTVCQLILESQEIPKVDHDYRYSIAVKPTCVDGGIGRYTCSMCRQYYDENIGPTGEHIYSEWELVKEPTSIESGVKAHTCTACSYTENVVINATGFETKSGVSVDYLTGVISGIRAGDETLDAYVELVDENYSWVYENQGRLGTGTKVLLMNGEENIGEYSILLYGDVNGDGWYDGEDAVLVNCIVNNMLSEDNLGVSGYMAADCNHDGITDTADIKLLKDAGMLLTSVDQTKPAQVLFESSGAYVEYLDIIDQSPVQEDEPVQCPDDSGGNDVTGDCEKPFDFFSIIIGLIIRLLSTLGEIW
jgi:C1A family cysteine protease